ncbi:PilN domain-containing protein [Gloeocapsa sp. PCC 73106]|uniref:PilN domain-containing protein n=1 Tax=Gloeocapsa sp. PCC 73106 TaxID=102232 RepID=UPI0002ACFC74|nr:PilN domain-containing protein [Gloeocapsa sp. PCC 73106]ELR98706.1 Tfp pilus assembly protein PilN [Gloeocapsa sp. PCC 73106]
MYNLDINFLKDRLLTDELAKGTLTKRPQELARDRIPVYIGGGILAALPLIALGLLILNNQQKGEIATEIQQIDSEIAQLQAQNAQVTELRQQVELARANRQALVSVFNQIKPMSAILRDISDQTPPGIQIESIVQTETPLETAPSALPQVTLSITGLARSFNEVNDFLLILQQSDFLDRAKTNIEASQKIANPNEVSFGDAEKPTNIEVTLPEVVRFTITTEVNEEPASNLITQLTQTGASGLVTRINTLKEKGAIDP